MNNLDKQIEYNKIMERYEHGSNYGLKRMYWFCEKCQLGWGSHEPFYLARFKDNGLWYAVPRPIRGLMPACPECRKRDNVYRLNRYKKKEE